LKKFIEMRGADGGPWRRICALPAFWVGLLYDAQTLGDAHAYTAGWRFEEVVALRDSVPREGLNAKIAGVSLHQVARDVLGLSRQGLKNRARLNPDGFDEAHFLAPLEEIAARGTTAAEQLLTRYHSVWESDIDRVFLEQAY
jgi:glutamate--cysteine ligase